VRAVETMLKILNYEDYPAQEVRPPVATCRWDATAALANMSEEAVIPPEYEEAVLETLVDRLRLDSDRHARIAAARGLGFYQNERAVDTLILGLRDDDFAVVYECENALVRLTGHTFDCNPFAWKEWADENRENLFADAGLVPESRRPPYSNRWEKTVYETRQFMAWLWPGKKE
jgi:hypothetical protein